MPEPVNPRELIANHTLAEHIQLADRYFDERQDHLYLYQKPFHHPADSPEMLNNLGQLLKIAELQADMQVLDFAAGSCWLSRILLEFGCVVTSCDASPQALDIGKQLFEKLPLLNPQAASPCFLTFDGEQLERKDSSFDRIIVNDAFHHIPNTAEVLQEFYRLLKPNGRVVMSEPGRYHSQSAASQFEMQTYQVIENDFILEDIWQEAQQAGFSRIQIAPVLRNRLMDMDDYLALISGEVSASLHKVMQQDTVNHSIFSLHKDREVTEENFDEEAYLERYQDVARAVTDGQMASGWQHYLEFGRKESRSPFFKT